MKSIGSFMVIIGILAIVLDFFGRVPKILVWIYSWGDTIAWVIKIALVVIGGVLYMVGNINQTKHNNSLLNITLN
ncbi:hypothetical protein [Capnocytophaga catalasegens]|uniref:DUF378 domain-containing protein n=1 Tax=Capnocytophaga catalasegens TaxID=1004260 RepID=A0AAV5AZF9_9FLAO|nr:hypothetical protein [Capnocytophaga catalasegens]GIZ14705.1 hypothetical protein RCZ03_07050 [Capnocytophaga catalasegens]GJM50553.1 hypothetical protein RCZ15_15260 [Capnocytophaga catalasegens]GJM53616.1 hypothetical protein RCZ16_19320 [Capnocytophaga catalasegens]